ncbi:hypothetical protein LYZ92_11345 [Xanthomonas hortorum pv. taraxaci]|nr:hypothetical protein IA64_00680 [Xanthomonas arboricola pv. celebensis]MCE4358849.1 hypothetical protein [Xanthomonas hortorum pv. taraxaci]NMI51063.1 hypothetical protein [Xanthomonas hortorum pv. taraxaci]CAD0356641.1 hypothetical protein NCPPB940_41310 [Xanthomonas hortorum pv. taraxaci]CAD0356647.1 hypothetical protein NCPPB940_41310 [Xanthomonas hortorum pv. taraxaci]
MLYVIATMCLLAVVLAVVACSLLLTTHAELRRQGEAINRLHEELQGHWKGHNYFHAQVCALLEKQPPPPREEFWG